MRRNFAQALKNGKIDIKKEYSKFYDMFYKKDDESNLSLAEIINDNFLDFYFRDTCLTLEEFDEINGFNFVEQPIDFNVDYLVSFMEYMYNFILNLNNNWRIDYMLFDFDFYRNQIYSVADKINYMFSNEYGIISLVDKDNTVIAVAESEIIPESVSYKVLEYNHYSMKGNLEGKKETLIKFADILEPRRKDLTAINSKFSTDLFNLFNNCNIRHNNKTINTPYYHQYISEISDEDLEYTYDEIYQMCLLAFMQLEHIERKEWLHELLDNINKAK